MTTALVSIFALAYAAIALEHPLKVNKAAAALLTGMGADGREGARLLKQGGSQVWAQDEARCVIYGMPMAIVKANLADAVYSLDDIGKHLAEACL